MAVLEITNLGNEVLRTVCKPIDLNTEYDYIQNLIPNMIDTVIKSKGVGIAAPQVGIAKRLIIVKNVDTGIFFEMINPEITWTSFDKECKEEGCLSVLDDSGQPIHKSVWRYKRIRVKWEDLKGKIHEELIKNPLQARIIQHETDHLNGKLFIDYLNND